TVTCDRKECDASPREAALVLKVDPKIMQESVLSANLHDSATAQLKVPPHSIEAEQALLGGLTLDNSTWDQVADIVTEADFYRRDHRLIFAAITYLAAQS